MEDIFEKGNKITTNDRNCLEVIDTNEYQVVCKDLLTDDFMVFSKTEHKFKKAQIGYILELTLSDILTESEINLSKIDFDWVISQMRPRFNKWL